MPTVEQALADLDARYREFTAAAQAFHVLVRAQAAQIAGTPTSVGMIQLRVAREYDQSPRIMTQRERGCEEESWPRLVAMALAKELTGHSSTMLGACFGGRDHGTILHAYRAVTNRTQTDARFARQYWRLRREMCKALDRLK